MTNPTADLEKAALHATAMLEALDIAGDEQTPMRLVRALDELTRYRFTSPDAHLGVRFPPPIAGGTPGLIVVTDIPFTSVCEHHLLPFSGVATVAYLPERGQRIVGLSKLARVVKEFAGRPQVQERLTGNIAAAIHQLLDADGAACAIRATHSCMALRGACTGLGSAMVTVSYAGDLDRGPWRAEFNARLTTPAWTGQLANH